MPERPDRTHWIDPEIFADNGPWEELEALILQALTELHRKSGLRWRSFWIRFLPASIVFAGPFLATIYFIDLGKGQPAIAVAMALATLGGFYFGAKLLSWAWERLRFGGQAELLSKICAASGLSYDAQATAFDRSGLDLFHTPHLGGTSIDARDRISGRWQNIDFECAAGDVSYVVTGRQTVNVTWKGIVIRCSQCAPAGLKFSAEILNEDIVDKLTGRIGDVFSTDNKTTLSVQEEKYILRNIPAASSTMYSYTNDLLTAVDAVSPERSVQLAAYNRDVIIAIKRTDDFFKVAPMDVIDNHDAIVTRIKSDLALIFSIVRIVASLKNSAADSQRH